MKNARVLLNKIRTVEKVVSIAISKLDHTSSLKSVSVPKSTIQSAIKVIEHLLEAIKDEKGVTSTSMSTSTANLLRLLERAKKNMNVDVDALSIDFESIRFVLSEFADDVSANMNKIYFNVWIRRKRKIRTWRQLPDNFAAPDAISVAYQTLSSYDDDDDPITAIAVQYVSPLDQTLRYCLYYVRGSDGGVLFPMIEDVVIPQQRHNSGLSEQTPEVLELDWTSVSVDDKKRLDHTISIREQVLIETKEGTPEPAKWRSARRSEINDPQVRGFQARDPPDSFWAKKLRRMEKYLSSTSSARYKRIDYASASIIKTKYIKKDDVVEFRYSNVIYQGVVVKPRNGTKYSKIPYVITAVLDPNNRRPIGNPRFLSLIGSRHHAHARGLWKLWIPKSRSVLGGDRITEFDR